MFSGLHPEKKLSVYYKPEKNLGVKPEKKNEDLQNQIFFLGLEVDLDFSMP